MSKQITLTEIRAVKARHKACWVVSDERKRENGKTFYLFTCCQNPDFKKWVHWAKFQQGQSHGCPGSCKIRNPGLRHDPIYLTYSQTVNKAKKRGREVEWTSLEEFRVWSKEFGHYVSGARFVRKNKKLGFTRANCRWQKITMMHLNAIKEKHKAHWIVSTQSRPNPVDGRTELMFTCGICKKSKWVRYTIFKQGQSKRCHGCVSRTHGDAGKLLYHVYQRIKKRAGKRYNIEWKSYPQFRNWALANGYTKGCLLRRKNPWGDYSVANCYFRPRRMKRHVFEHNKNRDALPMGNANPEFQPSQPETESHLDTSKKSALSKS